MPRSERKKKAPPRSGEFMARIGPELHEALAAAAKKNERSLVAELRVAVSEHVSASK